MRTLRLSLAGTVIVSLLGGLSVVAAGQDTTPVAVSGTVVTQQVDDSEEAWWTEPPTVGHARGFKVYQTWEWSDPRLPEDRVIVMNFDMYDIGNLREMPYRATTVLHGPKGYWTGTSTGYLDSDGYQHGADILTGHGAYDGLIATLHVVSEPQSPTTRVEGLIFEGEMPPMPEPVEPPAE